MYTSSHPLLFVCLGFSSHSRMCHLYRDVTFAGEGLQILTYARHSWPFSSEGSLACHTNSSARTSDTLTYCRAFGSGVVTTCFYDLRPSWLGFDHPTFRLRSERSNPLRHAAVNHALTLYLVLM